MAFTPYSTAVPVFGAKPSWMVNELDVQRIQAYQAYEEIYWSVPDTFKLQFRGANNLAIYVPSGRVIVDTVDRYTGAQFALRFTDRESGQESADSIAARLAFDDLFARERFESKYNGNKLYGIMRGDWLWHITADAAKPQGSRISITAIDPSMYFKITHPDDVDKVIGCHLAALITTPDGERIHRLTYRYLLDVNGQVQQPRVVTVEEAIFALDQWELPMGKPEAIIRPPMALPPSITALPVYHISNFEEPGNPYGSSEMRGLERIMAGINQTISDEDLTLAMQGIGMYATDAPTPDGGWLLGPGRVVSTPEGTNFNRVPGMTSTGAFGEHYDRLWTAMKQTAGTPDVAIGGGVDVSIAESGIALSLRFAPIVARSEKKNAIIREVHGQMCFDIMNGWYPAYEATSFDNVRVEVLTGSAIPEDRAAKVSELQIMLEAKVIDAQYFRDEMTKLGYTFPKDIQERIDAGAAADAERQAAAFGGGVVTPADEGDV